MVRLIGFFVAGALIAASAAAQPSVGKPFDLKVGESTAVGPDGLVVGFEGILLDSRCPVGVLCIWEGDAAAGVWARQYPSQREDFVLHTHRDFDWKAEYGDYEIELIAVAPYPVVEEPIPPAAYMVTMTVTGGPAPSEDSTWGRIKALYGHR